MLLMELVRRECPNTGVSGHLFIAFFLLALLCCLSLKQNRSVPRWLLLTWEDVGFYK